MMRIKSSANQRQAPTGARREVSASLYIKAMPKTDYIKSVLRIA